MMDQICSSEDLEDIKLCKSILAVMLAVRRLIAMDELVAFVDMPEEASADYEALAEIIRLCGFFLIFRECVISFIYQSAKDFLLGGAAAEVFSAGIEDIY